jgi:hypothetical protein
MDDSMWVSWMVRRVVCLTFGVVSWFRVPVLAVVVLIFGSFHGPLPGPVEGCVVYGLGLQFKDAIPHGNVHGLAELLGLLVQREQD